MITRVLLLLLIFANGQLFSSPTSHAQSRLTSVRTAYSALSAGIGTLWLTHEDGYFKKQGLDSNLIYIRGGSSAVQALEAKCVVFATEGLSLADGVNSG